MNQVKRITAFLLTFIMCLQVMVFSAFADNLNLGFDISADYFHNYIKAATEATINLGNFKKTKSNEKDETISSYYAYRNGFEVSYFINNETDTLDFIMMSIMNPTEKKQEDLKNFATLFFLLSYEIDENLDVDALSEKIGKVNSPIEEDISFSLNNISYSKVNKNNNLLLMISPNITYYLNNRNNKQTISQNNAISVVIDGQPLVSNVAPQSINGRTMVPVRGIFEALGATIEWNAATKQVIAIKGNNKVTLTLNSTTAYINGEAKTLESPAISYNGSTLVPARFVAEAFGATVTWDNATKTVNIVSEAKPTETVPTPEQSEEPKPEPEKSTAPKQVVEEKPQPVAPQGNTVYVTKTGKKYHYDSSCNGGTYYPSTLEEAKARGLTPCNKCT